MGGTRYNARGIDDEGNVANHTELEQIVFHHNMHTPPIPTSTKVEGLTSYITQTTKIYSYVQLRGSIPCFWEQTGLTTVNILRDVE